MRDFKVEDFHGCGQYLVRTQSDYIKDTGFLTTIMYKVGYINVHNILNVNDSICLISMSDGWVQLGYFDKIDNKNSRFIAWSNEKREKIDIAKQKLCDYLNNSELCKNEYRFATQEEIVRVVMSQKSRTR